MSIIILVGPSGSGKDTIGYGLQEEGIPQLVSFTTREIRDGEKHGVDYYYVDKEDMSSLELVESTEYSGNSYGLLKEEVEKSLKNNKHVYFIANADGTQQIKDMYPEEVIVFWLKIDLKTMRSRMIQRGDSEESVQKRLLFAKETGELNRPRIDNIFVLDANKSPDRLIKEVLYTLKKEDVRDGRA